MQIDGREKIIFGNDPVYGAWHWVRGPAWDLARGTHALTLSNHSDDIALQQIILLSDPQEHPSGQMLASWDIFYDGFDGCDGGNTAAWTLDAGVWHITEPAAGTYEQRWMEADTRGSGRTEPALAVVGEATWSQYSLRASVRSAGDGWAAACLGWNGPDRHLAVRWRSPSGQGLSRTQFEVIAVQDGRVQVLATTESSARPDQWTDVVLDAKPGRLLVSMAGVEVTTVALDKPVVGKVGFMVHNAKLSIDDVHVYCTGVKPQDTVPPTAATIQGPRCTAGPD
jgi:hypothetical protein